jgi:hypothetical protein
VCVCVCVCVYVCVCERERERESMHFPISIFEPIFADFHKTCYECYVIRTHPTLHSDCMQSEITER